MRNSGKECPSTEPNQSAQQDTTNCRGSMSISMSTTIDSRDAAASLPHRKVFMITEKSSENDEDRGRGGTDAGTGGRKRKMILIMDEQPQQGNASEEANDAKQRSIGNNHKRTSNESAVIRSNISNGGCDSAPKLLFFANSVDDQLSQKIEEILPEILSRIKRKNGKSISKERQTIDDQHENNITHHHHDQTHHHNRRSHERHQHHHHHHHHHQLVHESFSDSSNSEHATLNQNCNNSNLMLLGAAAAAAATSASSSSPTQKTESMRPITLPPKKNHTKLQRQISNSCKNHSSNNNSNSNSNHHNDEVKDEKIICAATPVIVSVTSLNKPNPNQVNATKAASHEQQHQTVQHHQHQQQSKETNQPNGITRSSNHLSIQHNKHSHHQQNNKNDQNNKTPPNHNECSSSTAAKNAREKDELSVQQQNINLTGDFLFLMKMLPMLEKTPEPRKTQVKILIEKIMKQCVAENGLH